MHQRLLKPFAKRKQSAFTLNKPFLLLILACIWLSWLLFLQDNSTTVITIESVYTNEYGYVETMACSLPQLNPFNETIQRHLVKEKSINCSFNQMYPALFSTDLRSTLIQLNNPQNYGFNSCCYNTFVRRFGWKNQIILSDECEQITEKETRIPEKIEFIEISCTKSRENLTHPKEVVGIFNFVHVKPSSVEKNMSNANNAPFEKTKTRKNVNVVIFGIDSVSHMNFIRAFNQSYKYMTQNLSAFGLWGHTKVGKNTFPNMVPALAGMSESELEQICWKNRKGYFDDCPFIWKNYSYSGYLTAYAEDAAKISIFNYQKNGFKIQPADYFIETMTHEQEIKIGHNGRTLGANAKMCYGSKLSFHILLDFLKQMAIFSADQNKNYFQFIWSTALTHDYLMDGTFGDALLMETLLWLKNEGYLENTVFILASDHGLNTGALLKSEQGKIENRMPFLYFILPDWFRAKYSTAVGNLNENKEKLTTPYDMYETLADLLFLENIDSDKLKERQLDIMNYKQKSNGVEKNNFPRGISLFLSIPPGRTCKDAAIPDPFCVCGVGVEIDVKNNTLAEEGAKQVVKFINGMLSSAPQCKELYLEEVLAGQLKMMENEELETILGEMKMKNISKPLLKVSRIILNLSIQTKPSNATFDAIVTRNTDETWTVDKEISRTNLYGNQSWCVNDSNLKNYCFCSDVITSTTVSSSTSK